MKKFIILVTATTISASVFAGTVKYKEEYNHKLHDYKAVKEVKTEVLVASDVTSPQDFYATLGVGYGKFSNEFSSVATFKKNKPTSMIGFGKQIDNKLRTDIILDLNSSLRYNHLEHSDPEDTTYYSNLNYKSWLMMVNAYYHFDDIAFVFPYVTAGLGYVKQKISISTEAISLYEKEKFSNNKRKDGIAYQVGFGVSFKMTDKMTFDIGYRYYSGSNMRIKYTNLKPSAHKIMAAIRMPL